MKQDASTIDSVMRTFRLSAGQRNFLLGARRGEGLFATKNWTPMEVVASPKEAEMANTTVSSVQAQQDQAADDLVEDLERMAEFDIDLNNGAPTGGKKMVKGVLSSQVTKPSFDERGAQENHRG